ncbi:MAG: carbonic anhydrase [Candidatus Eisenbacteria sp.]|nr:carbonic anhydrase [Candidatus Eisenbacteria bacterium]
MESSESHNASQTRAEEVLQALLEGNRRFQKGSPQHPRCRPTRRNDLLGGQHPIAAVLGCSDSRIPPEILFDQGLGDFFVVRVAGNVVGPFVLASLEYAAIHLETPLIVVLGHSSCGAIIAALASDRKAQVDSEVPGRNDRKASESGAALMKALRPAIETARAGALETASGGELIDQIALVHARAVKGEIVSRSPLIARRLDAGKLALAAAFYDMRTGGVTILRSRGSSATL